MGLPVISTWCVRVLRRFLRRIFITADGGRLIPVGGCRLLKVGISHLPVMLVDNGVPAASLTWDFEDRMASASFAPFSLSYTAIYDADHRRVEASQSVDGTGGSAKFVWDKENILLKTGPDDITYAVFNYEPQQFGRLLSQRHTGSTNCFHFDAIGSTSHMTDASQNITNNYVYRSFGELLAANEPVDNSFTFVGEYGYQYDSILWYQVRRRHYTPIIARWLSRDCCSDVDFEYYMYANNRPVRRIDPSGKIAFEINAFIPSTLGVWLDEPGSLSCQFGTDGRGFGGGSARLKSKFSISEQSIGQNCMVEFDHKVGESHRRCICSGSYVQYACTSAGSFSQSVYAATTPLEIISVVGLSGSANYPFVSVSPNINYSMSVALYSRQRGAPVELSINGSHNCFPNYEVLMDGAVVYKYDSFDTGPDPWNLGVCSTSFSIQRTLSFRSFRCGPRYCYKSEAVTTPQSPRPCPAACWW